MSTLTGKIVADFRTSLATAMAIGDTSATLQSATDDDGVALPAGQYYFTLDGDNSKKEHIYATLAGTALTSIKTVSRQGVQAAGVARAHRIGSSVVITNFGHLKYINDLIAGTTNLNASVPLSYDGAATISSNNQLATKLYVDGVALAGAPDASTVTKGVVEIATDAELAAGTNVGGTGAILSAAGGSFNTTPAANKVPVASAAGKLAAGWGGAASTLATLNGSTKVVEDPANATATSTANKIPIADANGLLDSWITHRVIKTVTAGETLAGATTPVPVCQFTSDNRFYKTDANDGTRMYFEGFVITTGNAGDSVTLQVAGVVSGFAGLTVGAEYFLSDTAGSISATVGTLYFSVGVAISATELLLRPRFVHTSGTSDTVATANNNDSTNSAAYVKLKEILVLKAGTYTCGYEYATNDAGSTAYARIYKNGSAFGAENSHTGDVNYQTVSENLFFSSGDLVQLYAKQVGVGFTNVKNMTLKIGADIITYVILD